jgi:tungstate transport system ATP-binding protein
VSSFLEIKGIDKNYRALKALDSVSLEAKSGKIIVLIGVNGAGKTTLMRIIAGLEEPSMGSISFNGQSMNAKGLRKLATMVFQRTAMFNRSVYDNVAFGLKVRGEEDQEIAEKVPQVLHLVGLANFEKRKARKTSGGEQQRISLARAFLLNPRILLLDEPTANLDPNSAMIIERAITSRKREDEIIIIATHNLAQARRLGDEIIHIYNGRIVERSGPDEFFNNPRSEITKKFINGELEY